MEVERLLLRDEVGEQRGEFLCHFAVRNHDRVFLQHVSICAGHLRAVGGRARLGDKRIAENARDDDGVLSGPRERVTMVSAEHRPSNGGDADLVE